MQNSYEILINKLDKFVRKYYKNIILRGSIYFSAIAIAFYLLVVFIEFLGNFNPQVRTGLFYTFIIINSIVLVKLIIIPLLKLNNLGNIISHKTAAIIIGKHFSNVKDKLLNVIQLHELKSEIKADTSLLEASIDQKITELKPIPFTLAIDLSKNKKHLKYLLIPLFVLIAIFFLSPTIITDSTKRIIEHDKHFEKAWPFNIVIENDELKTIRNKDFNLKLSVTGDEIPNEFYINLKDDVRFKLQKNNTVDFEYSFRNVQEDIPFTISAGNYSSKTYILRVLPNPALLNLTTYLKFPKYINKKDITLENTGDIQIPEGTEVSWKFKTSETNNIIMSFYDTSFHINRTQENSFFYANTFKISTPYSIKTTNKHIKNGDSITYNIQVNPDLFPTIDVIEKEDSLAKNNFFYKGIIKDDYGFNRLTFNYKHINIKDSSNNSNIQPIELNIDKSLPEYRFYHFWDMNTLKINPGDVVEYYFEVWDNDGVNGSKSTRSNTIVFKAPTINELKDKTESINEEITNKIEKSITKAKDLQKDMEQIRKDLLNKKELSWDDKQKLKQILEEQKELEKTIEDIKNENKDKTEELNNYNQISENILEKQQQLEQLMNEIMTEEMKQLMEELEEMMSELDKEKLQEFMEDMELSNEDIEKELDRTLELFKQMEFEKKLEETLEKINELKEEQEKLENETNQKDSKSDELKQKQDELKKEFEEFEKDLKSLEEKNNDLENSHKMENLDSLSNEIKKDMEKSSEKLEQNKKQKSSEEQKKAQEKMEEMSQQLQGMQQQMQEQQSEDMNALREILENLVTLSFDQEKLMNKISQTDRNSPEYVKIGQQQRKLKDDAKMVEDSLFALSKRVIQIESTVNREINAINQNIERALLYIQDRRTYNARAKQQYVMTSMNNLALLLSEILEQMQQQMQQQQQSNCKGGGCSKPGSAGDMQKSLNKQIEELRKKMGEKQKQGKTPGQGGRGMFSKEFAKMVAQQEAIRKRLAQMKEEVGGGSEIGKKLSELEKKMEETEEDLVNKRLTTETLKRQQEILTRLLEAEKSIREQDMDDKRQSKENKNEYLRNPSDFFEYNSMKQKESELLKTVPLNLNKYFKNLVNKYFNDLHK